MLMQFALSSLFVANHLHASTLETEVAAEMLVAKPAQVTIWVAVVRAAQEQPDAGVAFDNSS